MEVKFDDVAADVRDAVRHCHGVQIAAHRKDVTSRGGDAFWNLDALQKVAIAENLVAELHDPELAASFSP